MTQQIDIIIIGGGVSALLVAALLQQHGIKIAIIERQDAPPTPVVGDDLLQRAINLASQQLLQKLQLWGQLTVSPYHDMEVWEEGSDSRLKFNADMIGHSVLGHIVSERQIHCALYQYCQSCPTIEWYYDTTPNQWHFDGINNHLQLATGEQFIAPLIIGADGANSWLREQAAIEFVGHDYYQRSIVANVKTEKPHRQTAWQVFLPNGPLAFLPLTDPHQCTVIWSCITSQAKQLLALSDEAFCQTLSTSFDQQLGDVVATSKRADFALTHRHASEYIKPGLALVGDAAHRVHPLAGLGLNLAMADAAALAGVINDGLTRLLPIGHLSLLRRYERQRRPENSKTLWFVDQLKGLFANQTGILVAARRQGVTLMNQLPLLKRYFIHQAIGNLQKMPE